jgi:hypothetical protein
MLSPQDRITKQASAQAVQERAKTLAQGTAAAD